MITIDGPRLNEFLDKNRGQSIDRDILRTDVEMLEKAGLPPGSLKGSRSHRELEYFLLRTSLYRSDGKKLQPYLIENAWDNYCRVWHVGDDYHLPFFGKVSFICKSGSAKQELCHPDDSSQIETILVDPGALTSTAGMGKTAFYKRNSCEKLLDPKSRGIETDDNLVGVSFSNALMLLGLGRIENGHLVAKGDGLLLDEIRKVRGGDDYEKIARVILRKEHEAFSQVSSAICASETFERTKDETIHRTGHGVGHVNENQSYYQRLENACSFDNLVCANALSGRALGFAQFGALLDTYHRYLVSEGTGITENYAFLSWITNSGIHVLSDFGITDAQKWTANKRNKTKRHREFLLRFADQKTLENISTKANLSELQRTIWDSEVIDFNLYSSQDVNGERNICLSNVFISSKVPIKGTVFKDTVIELLQQQSSFRDTQGAFYYPDFRFLLAYGLGLPLSMIDNMLAYALAEDNKFRSRLWFFPAFGEIAKRDQIGSSLMGVVMKPFDSINLNF